MGKPYGMTSTFQVVIPSHAQDAIYDCVREAINANVTPEAFIREARECWALCLKDDAKAAADTFDRASR